MQIQITIDGDQTRIRAPFNADNNSAFRARGGKFDSDSKSWVLRTEQAAPLIRELWGESEEIVKVKVPVEKLSGYGTLSIGGYTLATRRGRDYTADIIEPLVAGTIPSCGGSMKSPKVNASSDAVFELEMRRDFAERHGLIEAAPVAPNPLATFSTDELLAEIKRREIVL